jgi:hypothetical protein
MSRWSWDVVQLTGWIGIDDCSDPELCRMGFAPFGRCLRSFPKVSIGAKPKKTATREVNLSATHAGELPAQSNKLDDAAVYEAPAVLRLLWADPQYMPEHLALWSLKRFGPRASSAVEKLRDSHPGADVGELEAAVIEHQTRVSMTEGAFVGGPFIVLIPVAFCAALLAQAQMALELAALAGYAPDDEMRAADLLVIQGAYVSTADASGALGKLTRDPKNREGKRLPRGTRIGMVKRMAYMLGMLGSTDDKPSRVRSLLQMALLGAVFLIGLVLPLVWVPYMAWAFRKSGLQMGSRASAFYAERKSEEAGVTVRKAPTVRIAVSAGFLRMLALIALPVVVAVVALLTGADIGTGKWVSAGIFLIVVSALATLGWFGYRWWRRRRLLAKSAEGRLSLEG